MAPKPRRQQNEESDDEDLLKSVMSRYKDRSKEKDEDSVKAAEDWQRFQGISAEESRRLGGSESTTHLVKGLDTELLRRQREHMADSSVSLPVPEEASAARQSGPKTELGKAINAILFNPNRPHPHNVNFKQQLVDMERMISKLPPMEDMPGSTSFVRHSRYAFRSDLDCPVLVMKSREELESEPPRLARLRRDPELIAALSEAVNRKKSKKKKKETKQETADVDADFDMFGGFTAASSSAVVEEGQYFATSASAGPIVRREEEVMRLQEKLLLRQSVQPQPKRPFPEDGESYVSQSSFGEKLDLSKFKTADDDEPKRKKVSDKQLFNQVMKRVNERDKS